MSNGYDLSVYRPPVDFMSERSIVKGYLKNTSNGKLVKKAIIVQALVIEESPI
jgi:hypothetical protein